MTNIGGGSRLDIYDSGGGSILLAWPELLDPSADSYNIYMRTGGADWALIANTANTGAFISLQTGEGGIELESGLGVIALEEQPDVDGWLFGVTGLQIAAYNPASGVLTPSLTYEFLVTAVVDDVEICSSSGALVTPGPTSIMLATPMRRPFPFPNTGHD